MDVKGDVHAVGLGKPAWNSGADLEDELTRDPYAALLNALPIGVFVVTAQGNPFYCNRAAVGILGRELVRDMRPETFSEEYRAFRVATDQLYPLNDLPFIRALRGEACTVTDLELRHKTPAVALNVSATPVCDLTGRVMFALASFTEKPPAQAADEAGGASEPCAASEPALRHARKLQAIGELAAGVAHEINTPMQYIGDNTAFLGITIKRLLELASSFERLLAHCHAGPPPPEAVDSCERELKRGRLDFLRAQAPSAVEQMLAGIDQVRSIVQALKEFSHPGDDQQVPVDINHLVRMAATVTRNAWRYSAELSLELEDNLPPVLGYPQELGQVLINLIVNAAHAIEERAKAESNGTVGRIVVRSAARHDRVEVQVADNGAGIPEAIRERIMDPFFTTKPAGKGTGQGLALARSVIVDRHAGNLSFSSARGSGTTFYIHLSGQTNA